MYLKMRAEKEKKKRELFSTILWSAVLICMIVQIALPETGVLGMVKEGSYAVLFLGIGGSCVGAFKNGRRIKSPLFWAYLC